MQRWKLTLEYKGTDYAGWQRQDNVLSVQQLVEEALYGFCQQDITVHAAGRTDAGVHAYGQVVHFDLDYGDRELRPFDLCKAINAHLRPHPVSVIEAEPVAGNFHARYDAVSKLYRYRILNSPAPPALEKGLVWHIKRPLDVAAMDEAAGLLTGTHDFTSFRSVNCQAKSPVRTLDRLAVTKTAYHRNGLEICIEAEAQSFLHHQVRNFAGSLALVGEGKWPAQKIKEVLAARDREQAGPTAPAEGLCLMRIFYK